MSPIVVLLLILASFVGAQPSLAPGHAWSNNNFTCSGTSYTGTPGPTVTAPSVGDFQLSTSPEAQIWWIKFGTSYQIATADGCWTFIGIWTFIPDCTYYTQAAAQLYTQDEERDDPDCLIRSFGRTYDITSGPCDLASEIVLLKLDKARCRARYDPHINRDHHLGNGLTAAGVPKVIPLDWYFAQAFSVQQAGGDFSFAPPVSRHHQRDGDCTLDFTPPDFLSQIPANAPSLYDILPLSTWACATPRPPAGLPI